jgi:hypothetical protein
MSPLFLAVVISSQPQLFSHLSSFHPSLQPRAPDACNHNATVPRVRYTGTGTAWVRTVEAARHSVTRGADRNALFCSSHTYTAVALQSVSWSQGATEVNWYLPSPCLHSDYIYMSVSLSVAFTPWIKHFVCFLREAQKRTSYTREWFEGRVRQIAARSISVLGACLS